MRIEATSVGDFAKHVLSRPSEVRVREVFKTTLYLGVRSQMVAITSRGGRSPFSINVPEGTEFRGVNPRDMVSGSGKSIDIGEVSVGLTRTPIYQSRGFPRSRSLKAGLRNVQNELLHGTFMAKLLYQASDTQQLLTETPQFRAFVEGVLFPLSGRRISGVYDFARYEPIIGLGSGFTPSGDDFVAGVLYAFNGARKELDTPPIRIPSGFLPTRTAWVSSMFLSYAQRGVVEESIYSLLRALWRGDGSALEDAVISLASRGHTSGLDTSIGILLTAAAILDYQIGGSLLDHAFRTLLKN